jgi:hypothetical protein
MAPGDLKAAGACHGLALAAAGLRGEGWGVEQIRWCHNVT